MVRQRMWGYVHHGSPLCARHASDYFETLIDNCLCREKKEKKDCTYSHDIVQGNVSTQKSWAAPCSYSLIKSIVKFVFLISWSFKSAMSVCVCVCVCVRKMYTDTHWSSFILIHTSKIHIHIFIHTYIKIYFNKIHPSQQKRRQKIT